MSVATKSDEPYDLDFLGRVQHLAVQANPAFAVGSLAVPLAFVSLGVALNSPQLLFYTHVVSGAIWFAFAIIFPAVIGPVLGGLDAETAGEVAAKLTPKSVFFLFGFSFATVLSGTFLLTGRGLAYGFTAFWPTLALGVGWGLFVFGLLVPNRMHLRAYYEGRKSRPDLDVLASIEKRNMAVGLFEAVVMLGIVGIMTGLRLGF